MSFSRNILWNFACPLTVNRVRLSAALTVICWHLRLGRRLGAFQIHTIRWRHSRLAPLTVTVTVSVTFRNVSIICNCKNRSGVGGLGVPSGMPPIKMDSEKIEEKESHPNKPDRTKPNQCTPGETPGISGRHPRRPAAPTGTPGRGLLPGNTLYN